MATARNASGDPSSNSGLGDTKGCRQREHVQRDRDTEQDSTDRSPCGLHANGPRQNDAWSNYDPIPAGTEKRGALNGSQPLAHGIPHRVGTPAGYGNAIAPQVAAQFIQAFVAEKGGCVA